MKKAGKTLKSKKFIRALLIVLAVIILVGGFIYYQKTQSRISIENSLVSAPIITVSPNTTGVLKEMDVVEGQTVKKGDTLAVVGSDTVRANTDGIIIQANNQVGANMSQQSQLVQMIHTTDMRVAGTIDENKGLNKIQVGQIISFTVDAYPGKTYWGYIDEISPSAKQTQLSFSISNERPTQQFVVYAKFNASDYPEIKNGMSAKMTVYTKGQ